MTGWRVDPAGLNIIITNSSTAIQEVGTALDGAVATVGEVQSGAGYDGIVSTAYQGFMQELFDGTITRMFTKYSTALEGTVGAANAYLAGDEASAGTIASSLAAADFNAASFSPTSTTTQDGDEG